MPSEHHSDSVNVPFGAVSLPVILPPTASIDTFGPRTASQALSDDDVIVSLAPIYDRLCAAEQPVLVVNDAYRHTPTERLLSAIARVDPVFLTRATCLVATGAHDVPTPSQLQTIFGRWLPAVYVRREIIESDVVLVVGSVEPHYFAGYTGGRKSLFPGLTDFATIERNHNLAASLDCAPLRLAGNPVAEHLDELLDLVDTDNIVSVQAVLDAERQVAGLFVGDIIQSFRDAAHLADSLCAWSLDEPYDVLVVSMTPPLDQNLYQAQKALENCQAAVRDGGAVILVTPCLEGVGSRYFFEQALGWDRTQNRPRRGQPVFGSHKLSRVIEHLKRISIYVKSNLPDGVVRQVFYEPVDDVSALIGRLLHAHPHPRVGLVRDGAHTVLTLRHLVTRTAHIQEES